MDGKPLHVDNVSMEITDRCATLCDYCYKRPAVGSHGNNLPLDVIKRRLDRVRAFTSATQVNHFGGEPLLHPDLPEIIEYTRSLGMLPGIVTSGKAPRDSPQSQYVLDMFSKAKIDIELSMHPGKNLDDYGWWFGQLNNLAPKRAEALVWREPGKKAFTLFSILTLTEKVDRAEFRDLFRFMYTRLQGKDLNAAVTKYNGVENVPFLAVVDDMFEALQRHFLPFDESQDFNMEYTVDEGLNMGYHLKLWGRIAIDAGEAVVITRPGTYVSTCPAMQSRWEPGSVHLDSLNVSTSGNMTFGTPACVRSSYQFGNIDGLLSAEEAYESARTGLRWIEQNIILSKASQAQTPQDYCQRDRRYPDGEKKQCSGCYYPIACNVCANEDWRKSPDVEAIMKDWTSSS